MFEFIVLKDKYFYKINEQKILWDYKRLNIIKQICYSVLLFYLKFSLEPLKIKNKKKQNPYRVNEEDIGKTTKQKNKNIHIFYIVTLAVAIAFIQYWNKSKT